MYGGKIVELGTPRHLRPAAAPLHAGAHQLRAQHPPGPGQAGHHARQPARPGGSAAGVPLPPALPARHGHLRPREPPASSEHAPGQPRPAGCTGTGVAHGCSGSALIRLATREGILPAGILPRLALGRGAERVHAVDGVTSTSRRARCWASRARAARASPPRAAAAAAAGAHLGPYRLQGPRHRGFGPREMESLRAKAQIVFQDPNSSLYPRMSVGQAIGHPLAIHGMGASSERRERVLDLMEKVGLSPAAFLYRKYPHQLSGGQSQRVVLARAPCHGARVPRCRRADRHGGRVGARADPAADERLKEEMGLTYLFITHDLATAKYLCDRIAVMYLGRIVELGTATRFSPAPTTPTRGPSCRRCRCRTPASGGRSRARRDPQRYRPPQDATSTPAVPSPCPMPGSAPAAEGSGAGASFGMPAAVAHDRIRFHSCRMSLTITMAASTDTTILSGVLPATS